MILHVAAEASSPSIANGAKGNLQEDIRKLMNNLEFRLVARMEEVLEQNLAKYSNILKHHGYAAFPNAGRPISQRGIFLEMSGMAEAASQREVNPVRPEGSEQKAMLATPHPSRPQSETAREAETVREADHGGRRQVQVSGQEGMETTHEVSDMSDANHDGVVSQKMFKDGKTFLDCRKKSSVHLGRRIEAEDYLQEVVQAIWFQSIVIVAILLQAAFLGWEANERLQLEVEFLEGDRENADISPFFGPTSTCFTCFFTLELLLRICAWRTKFFNYSDQEFFAWNIFDLFVVLSMALEFVNIETEMLRSVRVLRVTRVLRTLRMFTKLRKMVYALLHSMVALFWLIIMLAVTLYIFSLCFMQGSLEYLKENTPAGFQARKASDFDEMEGVYIILKRFGNVFLTMKSLFAAITGGDPWDWLFGPMMEQSWAYVVIGFFFVLFFLFAVMNVVTGVFVDEAMKIAQIDKDIMIQEVKAEDLLMQKDMEQLVRILDENGNGTIHVEELRRMLQEKEVHRWLRGCDIDLSLGNLDEILDVLDTHQTGKVDPFDFLGILSNIRGQARSVDLFLLHHKIHLLTCQLQDLQWGTFTNYDVDQEWKRRLVASIEQVHARQEPTASNRQPQPADAAPARSRQDSYSQEPTDAADSQNQTWIV